MRTMLCRLCAREDVAEVDVALLQGWRPVGVSARSVQRHRRAHMWAWLLDESNAGRAMAVMRRIWDEVDMRQVRVVSDVVLFERVYEWIDVDYRALIARRQRALALRDLGAARRLVSRGSVERDPVAASRLVRAAIDRALARVSGPGWRVGGGGRG
jgi:hypothetical protein